jgi:hypothetical protein
MHRMSPSAVFGSLLLAVLLVASASPAAATPPPFQAVGLFGDLAVIDPTSLLSTATFVQSDFGFSSAVFITGLARDPVHGTLYIVGTDFTSSFLARVDFATGAATSVGMIAGEVVVDIAMDGTGTLYGLTDNFSSTTPHSLFRIDPGTAAPTLVKVLDAHGGSSDDAQFGALAWNPADGSLYYADLNGDSPRRHFFVDKLAPGTFAQSPFSTATFGISPNAMAFAGGRLYVTTSGIFYSLDATSPEGDPSFEGFSEYPSADGEFVFAASGMVPAALGCVPSATAACLANRFKVEVAYDATPANGAGPGQVVLESGASVKFTFFDPGNIELILKVLDACVPPFNKWWVYAGGLTDVGVSIKVTDTMTGSVKNYSSTKGTLFQTFADTAAFVCP